MIEFHLHSSSSPTVRHLNTLSGVIRLGVSNHLGNINGQVPSTYTSVLHLNPGLVDSKANSGYGKLLLDLKTESATHG